MTRLQEQILKTFSENEYSFVIDNISYETLFKKTYACYTILELLNLPKNSNILLTGKVDENWMAAYYACLLKGVNLFIFPNKLSPTYISYYINRYSIVFSFVGKEQNEYLKKTDQFRKMPFLKGLFDLDDYRTSIARISIANVIYSSSDLFNQFSTIDLHTSLTILKKQLEKQYHEPYIYTLTSGTTTPYPKIVAHTHESIMRTVANVSEIFKFDEHTFVQMDANYMDKFHVISILNLFLNGSTISTTFYTNTSHYIFTTSMFLKWWHNYITLRVPEKFIGLIGILLNSSFLLKVAKRKLFKSTVFPQEKIIILNGDLPRSILEVINKQPNVFTTFGDEENNHAISYNDFSNKKVREKHCIGKAFPSVEVHSNETETRIVSGHLFDHYLKETNFETDPLRIDLFITDDDIRVQYFNKIPLLFFEGKRRKDSDDIPYDLFETELKGFPLIKNAIFAREPSTREVLLIISPDVQMTEKKNLGYMGLQKMFNDFLATLNMKYGKELASKVHILSDDEFAKTSYDDKNLIWLYRS